MRLQGIEVKMEYFCILIQKKDTRQNEGQYPQK